MDWTTSFQALTSKAASSYESLAGRWQELLEKVATGELTPSSLKDRLPQFLQEEGAEFYRRLSALSFDLFRGLSEVQARSTNDFMVGMLGDAAAAESPATPPPAPPAGDASPEEWTLWYESVTAFIAQEQEAALSRSQVLLEKVADGKLTPASVREFSRKFMNERALVLSRDAGEMQVRFYEKLMQLNQEFAASLLAGLVREGNAPADDSEQPLRIELVPPGEVIAPADHPPARPKRVQKSPAKARKKKGSR